MAAVMSPAFHSFWGKISEKSQSFSANTDDRYLDSTEYCLAHYDEKICFPLSCRQHNIQNKDMWELLWKTNSFYFTQHRVNCLYILFKCRFVGKIVATGRQLFDYVKTALYDSQRIGGMDPLPSHAKKGILRKKYRSIFELIRDLGWRNQFKPVDKLWHRKLEHFQQNLFEFELITFVNQCADAYGI